MEDLIEDSFAQILGYENAEDYKQQIALNNRYFSESQKYIGSSPDEWPKIIFNWNLKTEDQCFSFDGMRKCEFDRRYPNGLILGFISLDTFDEFLCHYSRRNEGELWTLGSEFKLAKLIVYLSEGHPITPAVVKPLESNEVIFIGGHHRYAIAKAVKLSEIPLYTTAEYKQKIDKILPIRWASA